MMNSYGVRPMLLLAVMLLTTVAKAEPSQCSICVVDLRAMIETSRVGEKLKKQITGERESFADSLKKEKLSIDRSMREIESQSVLLSPEALERKKKDLKERQQKLTDSWEESNSKLANSQKKALGSLKEKVDGVLLKWHKDEKVGVVLEKVPGFVIFASDSLDLTKELTEQIDGTR